MNEIENVAREALARLPSLVEAWLPEGRWSGREYQVGDLDGNPGRSLSINTDTGAWADFASGAVGGDPVSLYAAIHRMNGSTPQLDAARALAEEMGMGADTAPTPPRASKRREDKSGPVPVMPVPDNAPAPPDVFSRRGKGVDEWTRLPLTQRWDYRDAEGRLLGHVCRFDSPEGKDVLPQTYCRDEAGGYRWRWLSFAKPRPLYGIDRLAADLESNVVIVEGEKAADAGQRLLAGRGVVVVSWPGGGKAAQHVDWSPLAGRHIVCWPDADEPGLDTMAGLLDERGRLHQGVAQLAAPHAESVRVVTPPPDVAEGWDLADAEAEDWTADDVMGWLRSNVRAPAPRGGPEPSPVADAMPVAEADDPGPSVGFEPAPPADDNEPFACLGYDHGGYYYLPRRSEQVVRISTAGHSALAMLELAPLWWWEQQFPGRNGPDWLRAADTMITRNSRRVYDPTRIRGAGAWFDEGRAVLHLGNHLLVDGVRTRLIDLGGRYVYEAGPAIEAAPVEQASTADAHRFADLVATLEWDRPIDARLAAGWCVIAPICGALYWRPHVWITGQSGSGKTWVAEHLIRPVLGPTALPVQGNTTEAGIRQSLRQDARPILFDEAEAEDRHGRQRIQAILDLARQASSEANGSILKGSAGGQSVVFRVRSAFCLVSIGVSLQQQADQTRWTRLTLRKRMARDATARFAAIEESTAELLTPVYCAALRARAYRLIPVIRANARAFGRAAAKHLGSQRLGDQLGALLAGAYALHSASPITPEDALAWVAAQDWDRAGVEEVHADEDRLLAEIVQTPLRVDLERGSCTRSIAELIDVAMRGRDADVSEARAAQVLARHGMRVQVRGGAPVVAFSASHKELKRLLADSPWSLSWVDILRRAVGAQDVTCVRFGGVSTRAIAVPVAVVVGAAQADEDEDAAE